MEQCERDIMNEQSFKILKVYRKELEMATEQESCCCDECLATLEYGYYVAVLNRWLCPKCFNHWLKSATRYPEDTWVEERNYQFYKTLLRY